MSNHVAVVIDIEWPDLVAQSLLIMTGQFVLMIDLQ